MFCCSLSLLSVIHSSCRFSPFSSVVTSQSYYTVMHPDNSHDLHLLNHQNLLDRYESDEEVISESDPGGHDHAFSPVVSQRAAEAFDSDLSAESSNIDPDSDREDNIPRLLSPLVPGKEPGSRPVSMDTVKRSSGATFVGETFFLDQDDDMIIELPGDVSSPRQSMLLQPSVYVPESSNHLSRSASGTSVFSDESADLLVAEKVTYMEPHTRPNLIIISPFAHSCEVSNRTSRETKRAYRNSTVNSMGEIEIPWGEWTDTGHPSQPPLQSLKTTLPRDTDDDIQLSPKTTLPDHEPPATTPSLSEFPLPQASPSPLNPTRPRPVSFSRPLNDKNPLNVRPKLTDPFRRPPSMRSVSSASLSYTNTNTNPSIPTSPYPSINEDYNNTLHRNRTGSSSNLHASISNTSSPGPGQAPYYSSPTFYRGRTGSTYSAASTPGTGTGSSANTGMGMSTRSAFHLRNRALKNSVTSSISTTSLGSIIGGDQSTQVPDGDGDGDEKSLRKKASRKKSLRRMRGKFEKEDRQYSAPSLSTTATPPMPAGGGGAGGGGDSPSSPLKSIKGISSKLGRKRTTHLK